MDDGEYQQSDGEDEVDDILPVVSPALTSKSEWGTDQLWSQKLQDPIESPVQVDSWIITIFRMKLRFFYIQYILNW